VYVLDQRGREVRRIEGLTDLTGIAVDRTGVVHVSDLLEGFPAGGPGPGFDPSTVGQVVRIDRHGDRTYSQVTMPSGLVLEDGDLYASARSVGSFVMMPSAGQVSGSGRTRSDRRLRRAPHIRRAGQLVSMPPSTGSVVPVTYPPASLTRKISAAASSWGWPIRPTSTRGSWDSR
jgi:hypothetical protein